MRTTILSDSELIEQYVSGKESALEVLINRHKDKVYGYIRMVVKDRELADDIFQETFIKVIHTLRLGQYNEEGKFLPWVIRISHNLMIDYFRKKKRNPEVREMADYDIFRPEAVKQGNAEDKIVEDQSKSDIWALLNRLPEEQKQVVWMRCHARMSFREIAEETDTSINTALGRMRYALINLRKMMQSSGFVPSN